MVKIVAPIALRYRYVLDFLPSTSFLLYSLSCRDESAMNSYMSLALSAALGS
jgi:hypothetical protein